MTRSTPKSDVVWLMSVRCARAFATSASASAAEAPATGSTGDDAASVGVWSSRRATVRNRSTSFRATARRVSPDVAAAPSVACMPARSCATAGMIWASTCMRIPS